MVVGFNLMNVSTRAFSRWRGFILGGRGVTVPSSDSDEDEGAVLRPQYRRFGPYLGRYSRRRRSGRGPLLQVTRSFVAKVLITRDGLGKHQRPICRGASLTLLGRTGHGHCHVVGILARLAPDGTVLRRVPPAAQGQLAAKRGRTYEIHFSSTRPLFLSESDQVPLINRFVLMDSTGMTVAANGHGCLRQRA